MALTKVTGAGVGTLDSATITSATISNQLTDVNMSTGSVLQVVHSSSGTNVALANDISTFADAHQASITPRATSSKIVVLGSVSGDVTNGNYRAMRYRIMRAISGGATTDVYQRNYHMYGGNAAGTHNIDNTELFVLDSPSTTSELTYKIQGAHQTGSSQSGTYDGFLNRYSLSTLILMEIAG